MKNTYFQLKCFYKYAGVIAVLFISATISWGQTPDYDSTKAGFLVFHAIKTDEKGNISPWAGSKPNMAYDSVIRATWHFWINMRRDYNGLPYYLNHQVWRPNDDPRGVGGDQFAMALDSWALLYQYTGDELVKDNMKLIADYYLTHGLSSPNAAWPNLPFPYNTMVNSGIYDGDMIIGRDFTQPDKAGSFAFELIKLYKITRNEQYLHHAILIANTLATHVQKGDAINSPLPFKVNAYTGETGILKNASLSDSPQKSSYCTNVSGTLELFFALDSLKQGEISNYHNAAKLMMDWMNQYPMANNRWGPFFEDIQGWSDTQINAVTYAVFIMHHSNLFPNWRKQTRGILDWVYGKLGNDTWKKYGVKVVNEQTAYQVPGNSHTARQAAAELLYCQLTGDTTNRTLAIRQLNWATYSVYYDGKNCYPKDEIWMTDGYGDFIRHYFHAMAALPELSPSGQNHILHSTSVLTRVDYAPNFSKDLANKLANEYEDKVSVRYQTFDDVSTEMIRLSAKPTRILAGMTDLLESKNGNEGFWIWKPLIDGDGIVYITHFKKSEIKIFK